MARRIVGRNTLGPSEGIALPTTFAFTPTGRDEPVNIRTATIDGEPWFSVTDVCRALGSHISISTGRPNVASACSKLTEDQSQLIRMKLSASVRYPDRSQMTRVVSESGLYTLIMRSDKKDALAFQDWVTREVLPSIRKTGGYLLNEAARETAYADQREAMPLLHRDSASLLGGLRALSRTVAA